MGSSKLVRRHLYMVSGPWGPSQYKRCRLTSIGISMLKIRQSHDRLIFNMGIPYLAKKVFILRRGPDRYRSNWPGTNHNKTPQSGNEEHNAWVYCSHIYKSIVCNHWHRNCISTIHKSGQPNELLSVIDVNIDLYAATLHITWKKFPCEPFSDIILGDIILAKLYNPTVVQWI